MIGIDCLFGSALEHSCGWILLPGTVRAAQTTRLRRLIWQEFRRYGAMACEIQEWQDTTFFPWLRDDPAVMRLLPSLLTLVPANRWAEPQIVVRFPDLADDWQIDGHIDQPEGDYEAVVGINCTPNQGGVLRLWPNSHVQPPDKHIDLALGCGDVIIMHPRLLHAPLLNLGSDPRITIYFRLLREAK